MKYHLNIVLIILVFISSCKEQKKKEEPTITSTTEIQKSGNPISEGWYADPEGAVFGDEYWIYPTYSDDYDKQLHFDAFSSKDLVNWQKHERILDTTKIKWLRQALWAPSIIEKVGKYYLFFGANDIQRPGRDSYNPNNDINHFGGYRGSSGR
ncbi:family 43 glycosylhydrolase [Maribacter halichondriae]|uniref:family 43 glycosylhydrolase n=1 Tax=Maribacter halichondriae TaxID=2980554 RepID=UPI00235918A1|nr:family 43 glycosylhydrolase [Maribacter sp. Hal144]